MALEQARDADIGTLGFLGNRLPDREARVREFFLNVVSRCPDHRFVPGGSGWDSNVEPGRNVNYVGHVYTCVHNAFNASTLAVLNVNRDSMARTGDSPPTRVFEAAGARRSGDRARLRMLSEHTYEHRAQEPRLVEHLPVGSVTRRHQENYSAAL